MVELFEGNKATYKAIKKLGAGQSGDTFLACAVELRRDHGRLTLGQEVVLKVPRLPSGTLEDRTAAANDLYALTSSELTNFHRLRGLSCVAQVLDHGSKGIPLSRKTEEPLPSVFLVQQLIDGVGLDKFVGHDTGQFSGVTTAASFFDWARNLARALASIHRRQVVHGDLWPANILVTREGKPVFIDFGQAIFRDVVFDTVEIVGRNRIYMAPERARSVAGDVYSIGGVFFFLATGSDPRRLRLRDIDNLKDRVTERVLERNEDLYQENCGVVDIITRCLRFSRYGRTPHAAALLEDIDTFDRRRKALGRKQLGSAFETVSSSVADLKKKGNPFFVFAATIQLRRVAADLEGMAEGIWDLKGDHEAIVSAFTQFVAGLRKGDQYHTLSTTDFWLKQNLGVHGRFLSMNRLAAQSGAIIRRVFLVTRDEVQNDHEVRNILRRHLTEMDELQRLGIATDKAAVARGGYFTGLWEVAEVERTDRLRRGQHYGLVVRGDSRIIIYPLYREDGQLVAVQFRSGAATEGRIQQVRKALRLAKPLAAFRKVLTEPE